MQKIIDVGRLYGRECPGRPGEALYCVGHFCAFTQDTEDDVSPELALRLLEIMKMNGCDGCGSIPLVYPWDGPYRGVLKVDYVAHSQGMSSEWVEVDYIRVC